MVGIGKGLSRPLKNWGRNGHVVVGFLINFVLYVMLRLSFAWLVYLVCCLSVDVQS